MIRRRAGANGQRRSRLAWSLADQGLASGSNFLLLLLVVRSQTLAEVGAFGIVYALYFFVLTVGRGLTTEPLTVKYQPTDRDGWRAATAAATGCNLVVGMVAALLVAAWGAVLGGTLGSGLLALAVVLPALLAQDGTRLVLFAQAQPARACLNDALLVVVQLVLFWILIQAGSVSVVALLLAWGGSALVAALYGLTQVVSAPRPGAWRSWLSSTRELGPALAADHVITRGAEQLTLVAISLGSGLATVGGVTTARTLFAPLTTVQSGINSFALPEVASTRLKPGGGRRVRRLVAAIAASMAALMLCAGAGLAALPPRFGIRVFGTNWLPAQELIWPMTAFSVVQGVSVAAWIGIRGLGLATESLAIRAVFGLLTVGFATIGTALDGARGAVLGMACATTIAAVAMARLLLAHTSPSGSKE